MRTSFKFLLPVALLLLSGCAEMVKKDYRPTRGGTVRYSTAWFMGDKNRAKAVEEMNAYCSPGRPQLMGENSQREFTGQTYSNSNVSNNHISTSSTQSQEQYVYMHFKCSKGRTTVAR